MPGRNGYSTQGGWAEGGSNANGIAAIVSYDRRIGNQPAEYVASESITFLPGFESGVGDEFSAYITDGSGGSGSSSGGVYADGGYRYGFNGKENDNEVKGEGTQQDYGMRIYDPRLGRFLSVDPLSPEYPHLTPYQFSSNTPIFAIDRDGLEFEPYWSTSAPQKIREYENELRKKDPAHADQIIFHRNLNAFLFVGGALSAGAATATFWRWLPGVLYNPILQSEIVGGIAALAGYEGPDIPSPGIAVEATFKRTWQEIKIIKQEGKIISQEVRATAQLIMHQGSSFATQAEKNMAQKLLSEGNTVEVLAESTEKGVRTADYVINGAKTELKTISNIKKTDIEHLSNSVSQTLKRSKGQASSMILDVSNQEGATKEAMERGLKRYWGQNTSVQDVRVIGNGYEQTYKKTDFYPDK